MAARISLCFALLAGLMVSMIPLNGSASAQADQDAGTYVDPVYFFGFSWDPQLYEATELVDGDDVPYGVTLENDLEFGSLSAGGYASPRGCLSERSELFEEIEGVTEFEEVEDLDWPQTDPDARAALYRYEYENPDTGDTGTFVQYFECRDLLLEDEPIDDVVLTFDMGIEEVSYEDAVGAWEDILGSIEWDVEGESEEDPSPESNGGSGEGVDGNTYVDPLFGWGMSWDDEILTGENWVVDEDEEILGVQIFAEDGNFLTVFNDDATSVRTCANQQADILEGSAFSDFEEVEDVELPETSDDARVILYEGIFTSSSGAEAPIYFYVECRPMIVDGEEVEDVFLAVNLLIFVELWEDELELWSDTLGTIEYDVATGDTDDPDPDNGSGETGIEGDVFVSALGYQIGWNDAIYTAELIDEDNPDRGITITSEGSFITVQVVGDPDAEACVEAEVSVLEDLEGIGRLSPSDKDGPSAQRGAEGALFDATLTSEDGREGELTVYVECRLLTESGETPLFIVVSMVGFGDLYEDELPEWIEILESLEITEP